MSSICMKAATAVMILTAGSAVTLGAWQQNQPKTAPGSGTHSSGSHQPASGQTNRVGQAQGTLRGTTTNSYAADYRSCHKITGAEIADWNNEEVGTADDLVIDRGSGQITHVVVKSGSLMGLGGRSVLVPFREFQWDANKSRLVLGSERVSDYPVYTPESWKGLRSSSKPASDWREDRAKRGNRPATEPRAQNTGEGATNAPTNRDPAGATPGDRPRNRPIDEPRATETGEGATNATPSVDRTRAAKERGRTWRNAESQGEPPALNDWMWDQSSSRSNDPYPSQWTTGSKERIEGEIKRVERQYTNGQGEQVILEIAAADGTTKRVAVGPSWYVTGGEQAFNRGDRVTVEAMPVYVATSAQVNGKEFKYRGDDGKAAWSSDTFQSGGATYSAPYYRNVLVSELRGAQLDCRGQQCGKVGDVILEMNSGMVAFLSIDPNENFLGIADTQRLAPWSVVSIGADGKVRVDAGKEMMLQAMKTPSDVATLNQQGQADAIYGAYQVQPRDYDRWRDDDYRYNDQWRREREMWRRDQNFQNNPDDPNAKANEGMEPRKGAPNQPGQQPPR